MRERGISSKDIMQIYALDESRGITYINGVDQPTSTGISFDHSWQVVESSRADGE